MKRPGWAARRVRQSRARASGANVRAEAGAGMAAVVGGAAAFAVTRGHDQQTTVAKAPPAREARVFYFCGPDESGAHDAAQAIVALLAAGSFAEPEDLLVPKAEEGA